jgi:hypothetical protein
VISHDEIGALALLEEVRSKGSPVPKHLLSKHWLLRFFLILIAGDQET